MALTRLGLDQIWWLVTPANPLKDNGDLPSQSERMERAAEVASHPRIVITGVEAVLRTRFTADLIRILRERMPSISFVWIMGSDNLAQFHRWERWETIARQVPIAVVNRPGSLLASLNSRTKRVVDKRRVSEGLGQVLKWRDPPSWIYLTGPRNPTSSTALRG